MPERSTMSDSSSVFLSPEMLGYWDEDSLREVPDDAGIYCVFRATRGSESQEREVKQLLYVGEHRNVRYALQHHPDKETWRDVLEPGETLWYSMGLCSHANRERLLAAMIHAHKPRFNGTSEYLDRFPFPETSVHLYGKKDKLLNIFTVEQKE
ncbi:hypothetical protein F0A17_01275 [Billgrantia pellis]|uniref:GIY-YIG domain-containing protein n=1 Tax=Billgrantia pellis TaxID=2606936 RepID=A0A7V7KJ01_9GAMM|nr:hypothetical protein [Halomonas pellis]KAA0014314.1 hypothetical protein F0A17_01275 [Halomonas pellis]